MCPSQLDLRTASFHADFLPVETVTIANDARVCVQVESKGEGRAGKAVLKPQQQAHGA